MLLNTSAKLKQLSVEIPFLFLSFFFTFPARKECVQTLRSECETAFLDGPTPPTVPCSCALEFGGLDPSCLCTPAAAIGTTVGSMQFNSTSRSTSFLSFFFGGIAVALGFFRGSSSTS